MADARCILHVGAPKCGSSALQAALTGSPDLRDSAGHRFRYVGTGVLDGTIYPRYGNAVKRVGRSSEFGYASWPNLRPLDQPGSGADDPLWPALGRVIATSQRRGFTPILSNEGWLRDAVAYAAGLARFPDLQVDVVTFVRPPLDWVNAAYWQWGVWTGLDFMTWMRRSGMTYQLGAQLAAFAALDTVRLTVRSSGQDVVAAFATAFDLNLSGGRGVNQAASPALIGFQMRNRRFRRDGHDSSLEFVVQRWCKPYTDRKPWAILPQDIALLHAEFSADVRRMMAVVSDADAEALLQDRRWVTAEPYRQIAPPLPLEDRIGLAELYTALQKGVGACCAAGHRKPPVLPGAPSQAAPVEAWDAAIAPAIQALIDADQQLRNRHLLWRRSLRGLARLYHRIAG